MATPHLRADFRHEPLLEWVRHHRGDLVRAVLLLVQHWIAQGRPPFTGRLLGSYESWSRVVGGVLEAAGVEGFLENSACLLLQDPESTAWERFVKAWWEAHRNHPVTVDTLMPLAEDLAHQEILGDGTDRSQRIRLGKALSKHEDTVFATSSDVHLQLKVVELKDDKGRTRTGYALQPVEKRASDNGTLGARAERAVQATTSGDPNASPNVASPPNITPNVPNIHSTSLGERKVLRPSAVAARGPNIPLLNGFGGEAGGAGDAAHRGAASYGEGGANSATMVEAPADEAIEL